MVEPVVEILMVTYNHEKYITQAIESVLNQKTDFPFRLIIGEDCSTDKTREICLDYAYKHQDIIKVICHQTNQGLLKNYKSVFDVCTAEYLAVLEGDDYWIDLHKLQKQVDYLRDNINIGLVHSNIDCLYVEENLVKHDVRKNIPKGDVFHNLLDGNFITPATVMFRSHLLNYIHFEDYLMLNLKTLDYILWLDFAKHTHIHYLECSTAVYRISNKSLSHSILYESIREFLDSEFRTKNYICSKYNVNHNKIRDIESEYLYICLWLAVRYLRNSDISSLKKGFPIKNFRYLVLYFLANSKILRYLFLRLYYGNINGNKYPR